jgi:hypothetical protein
MWAEDELKKSEARQKQSMHSDRDPVQPAHHESS